MYVPSRLYPPRLRGGAMAPFNPSLPVYPNNSHCKVTSPPQYPYVQFVMVLVPSILESWSEFLLCTVMIQTKKIDLSHVTSKCGSLDNIHHRPGGGNVRIETVKLDFKDKAQAKVGSLDKALHFPGGGRITIESQRLASRDQAKARLDHGADISVQSPGLSGSASPHRQRDSHLSSSGSLNMTESPQLTTLAEDVTAALAKQGL
ncbi:hypothetical protein F2P81_020991 [Scophthalmus maximus]|uniref:Microtubule-associated protein n=1 Tax=Scophthalmus maximus TaxID=52904 RepID=A0A6A4S6Q6_SCOMX|nr:hypothetical protein F2P81_020991 [Scophthalmus maximus]